MANAFYPSAVLSLMKNEFPAGGLAVGTYAIQAVTSAYTYSTAHDNLDDVTGLIASTKTSALTGLTAPTRRWHFADPTLPDPGAGGPVAGYVVFKDTGTPATSKLIAFIDTDTGGAINLTLDGTDDTLQLNNDADAVQGLLRLGGLDATFTSGFGLYAARLQALIAGTNFGEDATANTDRFFVVGIDPAAGTTYTPDRTVTGDGQLSSVPSDTEVTDHVQIDASTGDLSFVSPRVRFDGANTTLPNDSSGTLKALVVYYLPTGEGWAAATGPTTRVNAHLVAYVDVADTTMDGTSDTIQWAATGVWAIEDSTSW